MRICTPLLLALLVAAPALAQPGTLDATFGTRGVTLFPGIEANAVAFQPDGKIVASGNVGGDAAVWRFLPDGTLDASFGTGGVATVDLGGPFDVFIDLAVLPSGAIVAVGTKALSNSDQSQLRIGDAAVVARFLPSGTLDAAFGTGGLVREPGTAGTPDAFWAVDVRPDGRIVAGGTRGDLVGPVIDACYAVQYLEDGTRDAAFGTDGVVVIAPPAPAPGQDIYCFAGALFPDGRYALTGRLIPQRGWAAMRLLDDGTPDPAFDGDGIALTSGFMGITQTGEAGPDGSVTLVGSSNSLVTLFRFKSDGTPDPTFGVDGVSQLPELGFTRLYGSALQSDGKVLFAGETLLGGISDVVLARVLTDGSLDPAFGTGGFTRLDIGQPNPPGNALADRGYQVELQADGRILVAGIADGGTASRSGFVARFLNDGPVDSEGSPEAHRLTLQRPAPNPSAGSTTLVYELAEEAAVRLAVYDVLGREVALLVDGARGAGAHEAVLDASRLTPGLYVVRLHAGPLVQTRRLTVAR